MARDERIVPPTQLTRKWKEQDVNDIADFEQHGVRLPNDFVDWSKLSSEVTPWKMTKEELANYNARKKK